MSLSQSCVAKLYASVIEDVVGGVREFFMDEGVDEQVLLELKHLWEQKLKTSKAVEPPQKPDTEPPHLKNNAANQHKPGTAVGGAAAPEPENPVNSKVAIEITLPGINQNDMSEEDRKLKIEVPSSALTGNQLQNVLTGPLISATMALPKDLATTLLQQHVNAALQGHASSMMPLQMVQAIRTAPMTVPNGNNTDSTQRQTFPQGGVPQVDGVKDSSDEEDNDEETNEEEENEEDEDKDEDEEQGEDRQAELDEEPLNSEDDVSEDDTTEMFETDNVVVCQYDKITRSRNKWKFYLKDGIMNLSGKDFVFQKSSGDAEW